MNLKPEWKTRNYLGDEYHEYILSGLVLCRIKEDRNGVHIRMGGEWCKQIHYKPIIEYAKRDVEKWLSPAIEAIQKAYDSGYQDGLVKGVDMAHESMRERIERES